MAQNIFKSIFHHWGQTQYIIKNVKIIVSYCALSPDLSQKEASFHRLKGLCHAMNIFLKAYNKNRYFLYIRW